MSRPSSPELAKIKKLIAATNIPRERVLAAYGRARSRISNPAEINNYPYGHPGWPKMWPGEGAR